MFERTAKNGRAVRASSSPRSLEMSVGLATWLSTAVCWRAAVAWPCLGALAAGLPALREPRPGWPAKLLRGAFNVMLALSFVLVLVLSSVESSGLFCVSVHF